MPRPAPSRERAFSFCVSIHGAVMREREGSRWANRRAPDRDPWREHDACGVGCVARASGERSSGIVALALQALARVAHRGAAATDHSGDGAGLLVQIPRAFLQREAARLGLALAAEQPFAVGMFFLPPEPAARERVTAIIEDVLRDASMPLLGWRDEIGRAHVELQSPCNLVCRLL